MEAPTFSLSNVVFGTAGDIESSSTTALSTIFNEAPPVKKKKVSYDDKNEQTRIITVQKSLAAEKEEEIVETTKTDSENSNFVKEKNNDKDDRTVFVGNLPLSTTRKKLASLFREFGLIESTRLRSIAVNGVKVPPGSMKNSMRKVCVNKGLVNTATKSTSQGYVVFESSSSIPLALQMNNKKIHANEEGEYVLRVDTCPPTIDTARSIFIGNLSYDTQEQSLREFFEQAIANDSSIEGVRVVRDKTTMKCKGVGYILFQNRQIVMQALKLNGVTFLNRKIRVMACSNKKRKQNENLRRKQNSDLSHGASRRIREKVHKNETKSTTVRKRNSGMSFKAKTNGLSKRAMKAKKFKYKVKKVEKRI